MLVDNPTKGTKNAIYSVDNILTYLITVVALIHYNSVSTLSP